MKPKNRLLILSLSLLIFLSLGLGITSAASARLGEPPLPPPQAPAPSLPFSGDWTSADYQVFLPLAQRGVAVAWIDPQDRNASKSFFLDQYWNYKDTPLVWSGDKTTCTPGAVNAEYQEATRARINYFRAMAGVPAQVAFRSDYTSKAQAAALMMSVNNSLSHDPPPSWKCYSAEGDQGAGSSNLALGIAGPGAISAYMEDFGSGNYAVGHRRWVLYPQTQFMGSGDIPASPGAPAANALWVFDDNIWGARPTTRQPYVAWPPPGYLPWPVAYARWSLSYPQADFSAATVTMGGPNGAISVVVKPVVDGYGENTLVWEPQGVLTLDDPAPVQDVTYSVTVSNIKWNGQTLQFSYQVTVFDPFQ